jgi:serine/threonine-protein kinase ATR
MIGILGEDEVGPLVDPTFAIIAHHWNSFDEHTQAQAHDMISVLFKAYPGMIRDTASTIPSLANIPLMTKFEDEVSKVKAQMDVKPHFQAFIQRCSNENTIVVTRALIELELYLKEHQNFIHEAAVREQPDAVVSQLVRSVLDTSIHFKDSSTIISVLAAQCLGLIGCLDPTRIEATLEQREMLVLSNFTKAEETKEFIVFFLREILVKVFLSTTNPRAQGFLAYAMQELLMFAEFDKSVTVRSRDSHYSANYHRWMELPESVRNTLTPFLTSKYCITPAVLQPTCSFPLYRSTMTHAQWLRALAYDLLRNCAGENARVLFPVLSRIVRFQDISIPTFLLPFAALNVIVGGTAQQVSAIETELQHVLSHPLPENDVAARDNLILCSQVRATVIGDLYVLT